MKLRLLTLFVVGLLGMGGAQAQATAAQQCDAAEVEQFVAKFPQHRAAFTATGAEKGMMVCTDKAAFAAFKQQNNPAPSVGMQIGTADGAIQTIGGTPAKPETLVPAKTAQQAKVAPVVTTISTSAAQAKVAGQEKKQGSTSVGTARNSSEAISKRAAPRTGVATAPATKTVARTAPNKVAGHAIVSPYSPETQKRLDELELRMKMDPANADQYRPEFEQLLKQKNVERPTEKSKK